MYFTCAESLVFYFLTRENKYIRNNISWRIYVVRNFIVRIVVGFRLRVVV